MDIGRPSHLGCLFAGMARTFLPTPMTHIFKMRFLGTSEIVNGFTRKLSKTERKALKDDQKAKGIVMYKKVIRQDGKVQITGGPALKSSGQYPQAMCSEVVKLFENPPPATRLEMSVLFLHPWTHGPKP